MFTFSFSTAFAYTGTDAQFESDVNKATIVVTAAFESAYNTALGNFVTATTTSNGYPVSKDAWVAAAAAYQTKILGDIQTNINTAYGNKASLADYTAIASTIGTGIPVTAAAVWDGIQGYTVAGGTGSKDIAYRQAFGEYQAMVAAAMRSVDTSVFSAEKLTEADEYTEQGYGDAFKEEQAGKVEAVTVATTAQASDVETAFANIGKFAEKAYFAATGDADAYYGAITNGTAGAAGIYTDYFTMVYANGDSTKTPIKYVFALTTENNIVWEGVAKYLVTSEAAAGNVATLEALQAQAKADLAKQIAQLQTAALSFTKAQKANVTDYIIAANELYGFVIDNTKLNAAKNGLTYDGVQIDLSAAINHEAAKVADSNIEKNVEAYATLETYAAKLAAETKDGVLVRDAEKVEKVLKAAKIAIYKKGGALWTSAPITVTGVGTGTPEALLLNSCDVATEVDAFAKEAAIEALAARLEGKLTVSGVDQYYTKEAEAVKALYAAFEETIKAATTDAELAKATGTAAFNALDKEVNKIKKTGAVDNLINPTLSATEYAKLDAYVDYTYSVRANETTFLAALGAALDLDVAYDNATGTHTQWTKWYAEQGARTAAEVKALYEAAMATVNAVPTKAELAAEKAAVEALVAALPAKITVADKEAVIAAEEAFEAYKNNFGYGATIKNSAILATKLAGLKSALETEISKAISSLPTAAKAEHKEAYKAAKALMTAYNDMVDDYDFISWTKYAAPNADFVKATNALNTIKTAEFNAIKKAINALPINITEANRAAVEAITALYDAYVAEYSDATPVAYDARTEFYGTQEYADYEAALETLEDLAEEAAAALKAEQIASVEGLKIKANSSAKKGSITVKWSTVGNDEHVEKYQVYKSTKAQKGYKKAITTTKTSFKNTKNLKAGTRYYYKVRAYVTVDGVKYYSDWSNKANRIAK